MAERDGDRDHVRPLPPWYAIEPADELGEEIVGIQFLDDQLQERARPGELLARAANRRSARGRSSVRQRSASSCCLALSGLFEVAVDVGDVATDLAHGSSSTNDGARERTRAGTCGGPGQSA